MTEYQKYPIGLREALFGLNDIEKHDILNGLVADPDVRHQFVRENINFAEVHKNAGTSESVQINPLPDELVYRINFSRLVSQIWSLEGEDRTFAIKVLLGTESDARSLTSSNS